MYVLMYLLIKIMHSKIGDPLYLLVLMNSQDKLKGRVQELLQGGEGDAADPTQIEPIPVEQQTSILLECLGERRGTEVRGIYNYNLRFCRFIIKFYITISDS